MAFNMPNPYFTDYVPGQLPTNYHSLESLVLDQGWNLENEVYTATPVVPQSSQSNNNKRKKPVTKKDDTTGSKKKQNKKAATNTIKITSATTSTESKQEEIITKQATKEIQMFEENQTTYKELSIKLTDLTLIQQQMAVVVDKYNQDINIKSELGRSLESWQAAVSNVKNRLDQIPQCRMCYGPPLTKPPKVVGAGGHKFCCVDCFGNYYNKMMQENDGQRIS